MSRHPDKVDPTPLVRAMNIHCRSIRDDLGAGGEPPGGEDIVGDTLLDALVLVGVLRVADYAPLAEWVFMGCCGCNKRWASVVFYYLTPEEIVGFTEYGGG